MRAMKRTVSVVLALVMVLGMMTMAISVSAAETNQITATSNFADSYSVDYNANANQVTVTYTFKTALKVVNFEGTATYDSSVLQLSEATFPGFNGEATANTEEYENAIYVNASNTNGYDFTGDGVAIANFVFNIVGTGNTTVNFDINEMTATTAVGTGEANDVDVFDESAATGDQAYTATATVTTDVPAVDPATFIQDIRISLDGKIGFNFYVFEAPAGYNKSDITIKFTSDYEAQNKTVALSDLTFRNRQGKKVGQIQYYLPSTMMTVPVEYEIYNKGEAVSAGTITVADWVDANVGTYETSNPEAATLLKAMLNYGAAAQTYFIAYTDNLANKNIDYPLTKITADTIEVPAGLNVAPDLSSLKAAFNRMSAGLEEGTDIRIRVRANSGTTFTGTVTCEGTDLTFEAGGNRYYQAIYPNVGSNQLDDVYTFTFSNGATFKTSVMSYIKTLLAGATEEDLVNLCSAIYWYNQAANTVFGE